MFFIAAILFMVGGWINLLVLENITHALILFSFCLTNLALAHEKNVKR